PEPRSCRIQLWDDGTFDVKIYHSPGPDSLQAIRYEPATSEIYWEYASGGGWEITEFPDGETLHEPTVDEREVRVITTVEPPYE
ncbi:hypothetical protein, partial [Halostagnicola kamekurae]|uniref:hypothetical protein n=1 Tax=Halostagnicola kamekurae TaxID=619731 RepID=UPI001C314B71